MTPFLNYQDVLLLTRLSLQLCQSVMKGDYLTKNIDLSERKVIESTMAYGQKAVRRGKNKRRNKGEMMEHSIYLLK